MKLDVPFYKQESKFDCGPTALKMVLEFLDKPYSKEQLFDLVDSDRSGITWSIGLAKSAAELGFKTEFYTTSLGFNPENYKLEFYNKKADDSSSTEQKLERLKQEAVKFKVYLNERSLSLKEILSKINEDGIAIILLDWSKILKTDKYTGHFVPIVGFDDNNVYVHNQDLRNPQAYLAIERGLFENARKSKGTDEDIIFIHRKA